MKLLGGKGSLDLWIINYPQKRNSENNVPVICIDAYIFCPDHYMEGLTGDEEMENGSYR